MTRHFVIPDTQVKPGVPLQHLTAAGNYIVDKKPDVVVLIGDFADMHSLSSYDKGKKSFEGRRYRLDIEAAQEGLDALFEPLNNYNAVRARNKKKQYKPRIILTLGNHEYRIIRTIETEPILEGTISIEDLEYEKRGIEVYPFLQPVEVDGITYCHYAKQDNSKFPITRAHLIASKRFSSWTVGHRQTLDYFVSQNLVHGRRVQCLMAGAYYLHDEEYAQAQGNQHWRGCVLKNEVVDGQYDPCFLSVDYMVREWL